MPLIGTRTLAAALPLPKLAICVIHFDKSSQRARLVEHRIYQPSSDQPLDFEIQIETYLLDLSRRFLVRQILYDPWQMQATAQRLTKAKLPLEEFPQSTPNLTQASQCLFDMIESQSITLYPDAAMRLAVSRAVAIEGPRGWRIGKDKSAFKVDVVVALAMACHAAVQGAGQYRYTLEPFQPDYVDLDRREPTTPQLAPITSRSFAGRWWESQPKPTAVIPSPDENLRQMYKSLDIAIKAGGGGGF